MKENRVLAVTPPMGWNSWDCYGGSVTEEEVRGNAAYMAEHLKPFGWEYIVIDIHWSAPAADSSIHHPFIDLELDAYARQIPCVNRYPSAAGGQGFKPLADYIHGLGLKLGLHVMRGIPRQAVHANSAIMGTDKRARDIALANSTCDWNFDMYGVDASREGAAEYYESLFLLFAEWGIDYIKFDDLSFPYHRREIELIRRAADRCGRDILLSVSPGPAPLEEAEHLKAHANMWRVSADFWDDWAYLSKAFDYSRDWIAHAGPGHWPDQDMLPLGRIGLRNCELGLSDRQTRFTRDEQLTMLTLWCMVKSPLMFGGELRDNDAWTRSLLTNAEVLEILKRGTANRQLCREGEAVIWMSEGDGGTAWLALFNLEDTARSVGTSFGRAGLTGVYLAKELWLQTPLGTVDEQFSIDVPPHGVRLVRLDPVSGAESIRAVRDRDGDALV